MTNKIYALVNDENIVTNIVIIDSDSDESVFQNIAAVNNATKWFDTEVYGKTGINGFWDGERLWVPQPFPSWTKDTKTLTWIPPVPYPTIPTYTWNESTLQWVEG